MSRQDGSTTTHEMVVDKDYAEMHATRAAQVASQTDKQWPPEEGCTGCSNHRDGPHEIGCTFRRWLRRWIKR